MSLPAKYLLAILVVILLVLFFITFVFIGGFYGKLINSVQYVSRAYVLANDIKIRELTLRREPIKLLLVGDIMLSRGVGNVMKKKEDYTYPFLKTADVIRSADVSFGNLEGPISSRGSNQGSKYSFRADPKVVNGLEFAGFDVLSIANNHILDWGDDALKDTVSILNKYGILPVGAGVNYADANSPVFENIKGTRIAFLAYTNLYPDGLVAGDTTPGVSDFNMEEIKRRISELSDKTDIIIVSLHWGDEYKPEPSSSQREIAHKLIDDGADIVVGHHQHVVQGDERYNEGYIFYGLGNFVFDQTFSVETSSGIAILINIENKRIKSIDKLRISISKTFQPEFIDL